MVLCYLTLQMVVILKANSNGLHLQDWDMIGATTDGSSETGLGELADKRTVKTYLDSYTSDWKDRDADVNEVDFEQDAGSLQVLWAKKYHSILRNFKWQTITTRQFSRCMETKRGQ